MPPSFFPSPVWAAAGNFALLRGAIEAIPATQPNKVVNKAIFNLPFIHGRKDTTAANPLLATGRSLPSNHGDLNALTSFFNTAFGMTTSQAVAIMGAHTLGRARPTNSGFDGRWDASPAALDNAYYRDLLNRGWTQVRLTNAPCPATGCYQWVRNNGNATGVMMLNPDMALAKAINVDGTGKTACTNNVCQSDSAAISDVELFAGNNNVWLSKFAEAWNLMVTTQGPAVGTANYIDFADPARVASYRAPEYGPARRSSSSCPTMRVPYFGICF